MDVVEICMIERESRSKGIVNGDGETRPRRDEWGGREERSKTKRKRIDSDDEIKSMYGKGG